MLKKFYDMTKLKERGARFWLDNAQKFLHFAADALNHAGYQYLAAHALELARQCEIEMRILEEAT